MARLKGEAVPSKKDLTALGRLSRTPAIRVARRVVRQATRNAKPRAAAIKPNREGSDCRARQFAANWLKYSQDVPAYAERRKDSKPKK
jgi:hypothetical protein